MVGVPSTLDHLIPVLSCYCLWEGLREVTCGYKRVYDRHVFFVDLLFLQRLFPFFFTLKVTDNDLVVVRASEEMMGAGGEAHRSNVATVGAVRLHNAPPFNVVQHTGAVLLTRGQQAAAGVHRHRGHRTSCLRGPTKEGDFPEGRGDPGVRPSPT